MCFQFHAEKCGENDEACIAGANNDDDVHEFKTYLKTRPASLELRAIKMITQIAQKYDK